MARLWIHIENEPRPEKFCVARENSELDEIDLNDICPQLCAIETLKNVRSGQLEFFRYSDRITPLRPGTLISTLNTTDQDPLVVRYPISDSQGKYFQSILLHLLYMSHAYVFFLSVVVVRYNLFTSKLQKRFLHTSGLWYL